MQRGQVAVFKEAGYGFIAPESGGPDVFFHVQDVDKSSRRPREGDQVLYEVAQSAKGERATSVRVAAAGEPGQLVDGEAAVFTKAELSERMRPVLERIAEEALAGVLTIAAEAGWLDD